VAPVENLYLVQKHDCGASLKLLGSGVTKLYDTGDNFQSTHFPSKDFSTHEKYARRSEGGPKQAPVTNFKHPWYENMFVAHL